MGIITISQIHGSFADSRVRVLSPQPRSRSLWRVEHGHLSVGLKIHCLGGGSQFSTLVEGLGGAQKILDVNYYKHCHASLCLVLPPVGSARSAILLLGSGSPIPGSC